MNVEINFTYLNMGLSLCLVCNLEAIRGRFRRVFGSVLFTVLFLLDVFVWPSENHRAYLFGRAKTTKTGNHEKKMGITRPRPDGGVIMKKYG